MKKLLFSLLMMIGVQASFAQTLEKLQWLSLRRVIIGVSLIMALLWMTPLSIMQRMAVNLKLK